MKDKISIFEKYTMQVNDLLVDAYKWKVIADHEESEEAKKRCMQISMALYDLYTEEQKHLENKMRQ